MPERKLSRRKYILVAGGGAAVAIIGGAAYYLSQKEPFPTPTPLKTLRISTEGEPVQLDPHRYRTVVDNVITAQMMEPLIYYDKDLNIIPMLSTNWENVSSTSWRFHLRKNVKFHDGTPFNAEAVRYNFDRLLDVERGMVATFYIDAWMESCEVEDEYTVIINTKGPTPFAVMGANLTSIPVSINSPTAIEEWGDDEYTRHPVGTGPFKFAEWVEKEYVKMEKNPDYWGEAPLLNELVFKIITEESTRYMAFLAGELDIISNLPPHRISELEANPDYKVIRQTHLRTIITSLNMTTGAEPLKELNVRRAIFHAIDRESIVHHILEDLGAVATVLPPPGVWGRLPDDEWGPHGRYPYDPEESKKLLTDAGWIDTDEDGVVDKDGTPLELRYVCPDGRYLRDSTVAEAIVEFLRLVGIKANLELRDSATWVQMGKAGDFDMFLVGGAIKAEVDSCLRRWVYPQADTPGAFGAFTGYKNPGVTELFDQGVAEMDEAERLEMYYNAQRIIADDAAIFPIWHVMGLFATVKDVENFETLPNEIFALKRTDI